MNIENVYFRIACEKDIAELREFVDFWLSGRGVKVGAVGAVNDYFFPKSRHIDHIRRYIVLLAIEADHIVGWGVQNKSGVLFHLLIAGTHRGIGIGSAMINILKPNTIRSKADQSSGNPGLFYEKVGFYRKAIQKVGRNKNIDLYLKADIVKVGSG